MSGSTRLISALICVLMGLPFSRATDTYDDTGQMPVAVHAICPACQMPTDGAEVIPGDHVIACDRCGARTPFEPLPPLLLLTGASGAGKTTIARALNGRPQRALPGPVRRLHPARPGAGHDRPHGGRLRGRGTRLDPGPDQPGPACNPVGA